MTSNLIEGESDSISIAMVRKFAISLYVGKTTTVVAREGVLMSEAPKLAVRHGRRLESDSRTGPDHTETDRVP
jgi:hypothetical protein